MARWEQTAPDRWVRDNDERHLLLHTGPRYVEFHGTVVHVYDGPETADADNPLGEATYVRTEPRGLHDASAEELWDILADPRYTTSTEQEQANERARIKAAIDELARETQQQGFL